MEEEAPAVNGDVHENGVPNGDAHNDESDKENNSPKKKKEAEKAGALKKKVTLSYEKYRRIANMVVIFIRQEEEKSLEGKWFSLILLHYLSLIVLSRCL